MITQTKSKRILVVDDDVLMVGILERVFQAQGYKVVSAYDGPSGLVKAILIKPDLIVLDIMMPGMDGYEVCRRLKENPTTTNIAVLMLTAKGNIDAPDGVGNFEANLQERLRGFDVGAVEFISKPVGIKDLMKRLEFLI